jgi:hypothetical protein
MTGARFPIAGVWTLQGPAYDYFHAGFDLAARIAAGLSFGSLPLPRGAVLYAADYSPARFETRLAEWAHYHGAALAFDLAHVPAPVGAGHTLAHHVGAVGPVAVIVDSPEPARQLMTGLRSLAMRFSVPILCATPVPLPSAPILLACERTDGRSGQVTLQTAFGGRLVARYSATASRGDRSGIPLLEVIAPESNTSPEPRKRPARAQAPVRAPRDGPTPKTAPATAASDLAT